MRSRSPGVVAAVAQVMATGCTYGDAAAAHGVARAAVAIAVYRDHGKHPTRGRGMATRATSRSRVAVRLSLLTGCSVAEAAGDLGVAASSAYRMMRGMVEKAGR